MQRFLFLVIVLLHETDDVIDESEMILIHKHTLNTAMPVLLHWHENNGSLYNGNSQMHVCCSFSLNGVVLYTFLVLVRSPHISTRFTNKDINLHITQLETSLITCFYPLYFTEDSFPPLTPRFLFHFLFINSFLL